MANDRWSYIGVFLDEESSTKLMNALHEYIPNGWKVYCHHMTLAFNDHSQNAKNFYEAYSPRFGEKCQLQVIGWGISDKALAVQVLSPCKTNNKIPHITVAVSGIGRPVDSNYIQEWHPVENGMALNGIINEWLKVKYGK